MTTTTASIAAQFVELVTRKEALRDEMLTAHGKTDTRWYRDRANEMASLNRWHALLLQRQRVLGPVG